MLTKVLGDLRFYGVVAMATSPQHLPQVGEAPKLLWLW